MEAKNDCIVYGILQCEDKRHCTFQIIKGCESFRMEGGAWGLCFWLSKRSMKG
jgi:hypothetical protein